MLLEKYKPQTFDDFVGMENEKSYLKNKIESNEGIPHLLFLGQPGCGKTLLSNLIGKEVLKDSFNVNFFEFNASKDNGVDFIRNEINTIARRRPFNASYKIILMDEADHMTSEAQACCRRIIENTASITRFIFTGNFSNKIITPIVSRCTSFDFVKPSKEELIKYVKNIITLENITMSDDEIDCLIEKSKGDFRQILSLIDTSNFKVVTESQIDSMSFLEIINLPLESKLEICFKEDPEHVFNILWEKLKESKAWKYINIFADCNYKMRNSVHKNLFLANLFQKLV
jgi:replication factor C small subunit